MNYFESFAVELSSLNEVTFQRLHYCLNFFIYFFIFNFERLIFCVCVFVLDLKCFFFGLASKRLSRIGREESAFDLNIQREIERQR